MSENDAPAFSAICARWTSRHPIAVLCVALAVTVVAACGLTRIEFQTRIDDFRHPESKALIRTVGADFREGNHLYVIFESKHAQVSLLEPRMLQQQFRVMQAIKQGFPVDTISLVDAVDQGLRRVKGTSLSQVSDYTTIAEGLLGLSGGRTVWDLEKASRHLLSEPEAIGFYTRLRLARSVMPVPAPLANQGGQKTEFFPPALHAIKAIVQFTGGTTPQQHGEMAAQIRDLARSFISEDLNIYATGEDLVTTEIDERTLENFLLLGTASLLSVCLFSWITFLQWREVLITVLIVGAATIWTFGLAGFLGIHLAFLHLMVLPILWGTGDDNSLVLGRQLAEERRDSPDLATAIERAFQKLGMAIFLTTFTTFVAFLVGAWSSGDSSGTYVLNLLVAFSMMAVYIATVHLQGPLRMWLGETPHGASRRDLRREALERHFARFTSFVGSISLWLLSRHRRKVVLAFCGLGFVGFYFGRHVESEFSRKIFLQPSMQTALADEVNDRHFDTIDHGYILFEGDVENPTLVMRLEQLEAELAQFPIVLKVLRRAQVDSIVELTDKLSIHVDSGTDMRAVFDRIWDNQTTANYSLDQTFHEAAEHRLRKHGDHYDGLLVKFFVTAGEGRAIRGFVEQLKGRLAELGFNDVAGVRIRIGAGDIAYYLDEGFYFWNFAEGFFVSLAINGLILLIRWRSVSLALLALLPVVFALVIAMGVMVLFGVKLNVLTLCIGAVLVGMGVDCPIHIIERHRDEQKLGGTGLEIMRRTVDSIGPSVWGTTLTTVIGFAACSILALPVAVSFGLLMAGTIFWAYLTSIFLLPALLLRSDAK